MKRVVYIVLICLICGFAVYMYCINGRTIFEDSRKPTEKELKIMEEIIVFEQEKLCQCQELLSHYDDRIKELGIEIRPVLRQTRAVNQQGLVEKHDWNKDKWLPKYYSSSIMCYVYKEGKLFEKRTSYNSTSYFVDIFQLLHARKKTDTAFNENPFGHFDAGFDSLLKQISEHLSQ